MSFLQVFPLCATYMVIMYLFMYSLSFIWTDVALMCNIVTNVEHNKIAHVFFCVSLCLSEVAPYLQGGGWEQQVALEGNRLVLTCPAGGSWPLQYRWTFNNSNITDWTPQYRSVMQPSGDFVLAPTTFPCSSNVFCMNDRTCSTDKSSSLNAVHVGYALCLENRAKVTLIQFH